MDDARFAETQSCLLNAVFYRAGTHIPFAARFGPHSVLYNHTTCTIAQLDHAGNARLEAGGVYTVEEPDSVSLRHSRMPEAVQQPQSRRHSEMPPGFFKTFALGRSNNRRRSESSLAVTQRKGSKGSILGLKIPMESSKEEPESGGGDSKKWPIAPSKTVSGVLSAMATTPTDGPSEGTGGSFFTLRRKTKKPSGDEDGGGGDGSAEGVAQQPGNALGAGKGLSKTTENLVTAENASVDDVVDLLDFLKSPPKRERSRSNEREPHSTSNSASPNGAVPARESTAGSRASAAGGQPVASMPAITSQETASEKRTSILSLKNQMMVGSSPLTSAPPTLRLKAGQAATLLSEQDSSAAGSGGTIEGQPSMLSRVGSTQDVGGPGGRSSHHKRPVSGGFLVDPDPPSYEGFLRSDAVPGVNLYFRLGDSHLRAFRADFHLDLYGKEFHVLLDTLRSESKLLDDAALQLTEQEKPETVPRSPVREKSTDDLGRLQIQYQPDEEGLQTPFHVTQATLDKLVERMTSSYGPDKNFISMMLHTYRHVTNPVTMMTKLTARLHVSAPLESDPDALASNESWKPVLKIRTISVVLTWIKHMWVPDFVTPEMREELDKFVRAIRGSFGSSERDKALDESHAHEFQLLAGHLRGVIKQLEIEHDARAAQTTDVPRHPPPLTKQEFLGLDLVELARHLTIREHEQLCDIKPIHFLLRLWTDKDPIVEREVQPITNMVGSFNTPELKNRVKVVESFIKLARECRKLNNFNTVMAIVSGLNLVAVSRLKATWEAVEQKRVKQLNELESVLSPTGNFRVYRSLVEEFEEDTGKARRPYIPILSLFLKDLLFMNDGNPKHVDSGFINVDKLRTLYTRVQQFLAVQQADYQPLAGTPSTLLQSYCAHLHALDENKLYKYSCLCEPKMGTEELRLREKWMSKQ
nr:hypothetical protein HK105_007708 [Polyrhizophydium stewartii]